MRAPVVQLCIDVGSAATSLPLPRPPTSEEAGALVAFMERAVGRFELTRPWAASDMIARVEGVGARYDWERIAFTEEAIVGVERTAGRVETEGPGGPRFGVKSWRLMSPRFRGTNRRSSISCTRGVPGWPTRESTIFSSRCRAPR